MPKVNYPLLRTPWNSTDVPTAAQSDLGRGAGQATLAEHNLRVVTQAIHRCGEPGISRVELAQATGLASQTITNVVRRLLDAGLLVESGLHSRGPGKPRTLLQINPAGAYAVGVHIDPLLVNVVLLDLGGGIVARAEHAAPDDEAPATTLDLLATTIWHLVDATKIPRERIAGLGVATPGPVDLAQGMLIDPPLMPLWHHTTISEELRGRTGLDVVLQKDVMASATGEMHWRLHDAATSFLFCYVGTGTGVAATVHGILQRGSSGNAGEIGHSARHGPDGRCGACGRTHFGVLAAPDHWCRLGTERGLIDPLPERGGHPLPRDVAQGVQQLATLARSGSEPAREIFSQAGRALGVALADMTDLVDVAEVVMGGPYWGLVSDLLTPVMTDLITDLPALSSVRPVTLHTSPHGQDGSALGAASIAIQQWFPKLLPPSP